MTDSNSDPGGGSPTQISKQERACKEQKPQTKLVPDSENIYGKTLTTTRRSSSNV